jgi:aspartyl-tRNA(Asn)/glutamyl-tRNA(Gln) amidotransferase subunit A
MRLQRRAINGARQVETVRLQTQALATDLIQASRERKLLAATLAELFTTEADLLLTPTVGVAATCPTQKTLELSHHEFDPIDVMIHFLCGFSHVGVPALAVPTGFDADGMPLSLQIIGRRLDDARVLSAGRAFEAARPWSAFRPILGRSAARFAAGSSDESA